MKREDRRKSYTWDTFKIYWQHAKKYPKSVFTLVFTTFAVVAILVYIPILYRDLINLLAGSDRTQELLSAALGMVVIILLFNIFQATGRRIINFTNNYFQPSVMRDLNQSCYGYLQKHSNSFFNSTFVGSLVTRVKRFERGFEVIADQLTFDMGRAGLDILAVMIVLFVVYPMFGLIFLAWMILFLFFVVVFTYYKMPYDLERADADTKMTAQLADSITNNLNIKLFTGYKREDGRFGKVTERQRSTRKKSWDLGTFNDVVQAILMIGLEFIVIYFAVHLWQKGTFGVGEITLLQAYMFRIFHNLWRTGINIRRFYEALADANEMTEILLRDHSVKDAQGAKELVVKKGEIAFDKAGFQYKEGIEVLSGFDLKIKAGERVAFVGPSGGGKSTIVKLLFRFHDLDAGNIKIDGQDISQVSQNSLRENVSLVPQDPILFHRPIIENIRYAKPNANDKEVMEAAKKAHAHEFISRFPNGYDTLVGERGVKLSGGERQRVAIARAILKDAPILVLDEATSSLDSESEMFIQDALKKLMKGRTTIVVAHRLSTIMQMDRIVVIQNGDIIEEGKHDELLKAQQGMYQKLWEIQAGGFA
jgi:ATP-binding cassette subfamily B protein